jgi:N-acetylglucosaminyl-diphospho-decaprenol L-rhamnosyltransferase
VISHGHHSQVCHLLSQLAQLCANDVDKVVITDNLAEHTGRDYLERIGSVPFKIEYLSNPQPLGFGANHNQAFALCTSDYFCVINPDIDLINNPFTGLNVAMSKPEVGLTYPAQVDSDQLPLDFERPLVSLWSLVKRYSMRAQAIKEPSQRPDWASGAFLVFKSEVFRALGGFDEQYFMYCEDVEICLRAQLAGHRLARADAVVVHHTQRRTLKSVQHFAWHVRSLLRLWGSRAYRDYKKQFMGVSN